MEQLIATFHIDIPLIIAQVVNFAIVLLVLYYFALKPLMKVMEKRSVDIADGLKNFEQSKMELERAEQERERIVQDAKKEAVKIVSDADTLGNKERVEILAQAELDKQKIIDQAQSVIDHNTKKAEQVFRAESAEILTQSMEQLFKGYVQSGKGDAIIKEIMKQKI